jgi:hypothetical protein
LLDVSTASYSTGRPFFTLAGSGLYTGRCAISAAVAVLTTLMLLSKRVKT